MGNALSDFDMHAFERAADIQYFRKLRFILRGFNLLILLAGSFFLFCLLVPEDLAVRLPPMLEGLDSTPSRLLAGFGMGCMGWMSWWCGKRLELASATLVDMLETVQTEVEAKIQD